MGKWGSRSFCKSSSLLLLPPHAFPLLHHGVRHGALHRLRPAWLLHQALPSACREQCTSFLSGLAARRTDSLLLTIFTSLLGSTLPFLKSAFPEVPPSLLTGFTCALQQGRCRTGWDQLCPAQGSSGSPHKGPCC